MSLFKKLFGDSEPEDNKSEDNRPDLEKLLAADNVNSSIIALDNYICKLCVWGEELNKLTEEQKAFYYNQELEREVNNGGFNQYFFNSAGNYAHKTVESLKLIGAYKTADILQQAINQFPLETVPVDRAVRQETLLQIQEKADETWNALDQKFFSYEDDLNGLNIEFVRRNKENF